jgi:hypothetical protein
MKKKKRKVQACQEKPCSGRFARTCCRAAVIATSYQIFSLGVGAVMDHPQLLLRREQDKTIIERVASNVSSSLDEPVYGWCLCAHLGQSGPGGGGGCTGCMSCQGCTGSCISGCTGYTAEQQRQDEEQEKLQEEERQRQTLEEQRKAQEFEESKQRALEQFKGAESSEPGLKGFESSKIGLKGFEKSSERGLKEDSSGINTDTSVVDLRGKKKPYAPDLSVVKGATPQLRRELLGNFSDIVSQRTSGANEQAQEILRSFKTGEPPSPVKNIRDLAPGDVILVDAIGWGAWFKGKTKEHLKDVALSQGIRFFDGWFTGSESPYSHAALFLGKRNGKNWYLDNTSAGPIIKDEKEFLKQYGQRRMDVATIVGQPLSRHEGEELWKGAHELRKTAVYSYGMKFLPHGGNDAMVCSEASRWLLVRAGRRVPETRSDNIKKRFVNFSPADFYEEQQYFVIHELGMKPMAEGGIK